jgi:hypothetical protein
VTDGPILEALRAAIATVTGSGATQDPERALVAIGWATVETDRAIAELAGALGVDASAFRTATGSSLLGSFVLVAGGILDGAIELAVVEPATEGRLAAHLARHGEGPTVAWLAESGNDRAEPRNDLAGPTEPSSEGPFGRERLLPPRPDGVLRLLVPTPPGTI